MLTNRDPIELTALRRDLHRHPEISGEEAQTAATIVRALTPMNPTGVITGMGGHGVLHLTDPQCCFVRNWMRYLFPRFRKTIGYRRSQARGICAAMTGI